MTVIGANFQVQHGPGSESAHVHKAAVRLCPLSRRFWAWARPRPGWNPAARRAQLCPRQSVPQTSPVRRNKKW